MTEPLLLLLALTGLLDAAPAATASTGPSPTGTAHCP